MNKKKTVGILVGICIAITLFAVVFLMQNDEKTKNQTGYTLKQVQEIFSSDIQALKEGTFENLVYNEFETSIADVEGVYNIELLSDNSFQDKTPMENFEQMNHAIDKFFLTEFDKSFITVSISKADGETIDLNYNDVLQNGIDESYNKDNLILFGNITSEGGYMVQTMNGLLHTWFSKGELGTITPSSAVETYKKIYPYVSCVRQGEDAVLKLKDSEVSLSEMEEKALRYMNGEEFPLNKSEDIHFGIGEARIVENGESEGVCFIVRRIYKGIPFEYGSHSTTGAYHDEFGNDCGELSYAESTSPDTMLAFGRVDSSIVETKEITELISAGDALELLSQKIGGNSIYDVHGIELVYRNNEIPKTRGNEVDGMMSPKWKVITINQNDDKYTIFYIDVVTGEITERFEYYYDV